MSKSDLDPQARQRYEGRVFALTLFAGFVFVAAVAYLKGREVIGIAAASLAGVALIAGVLIPGHLEFPRRAWMKLGEIIGRVTNPVILAIIYYAVVTPTGLLRRSVGLLGRKRHVSGWHRRPPASPPARMERQF